MHESTAETASPNPRGAVDQATLFLRDVGAAVNADVYHRGARRLTVRRELPFLRVGADVVDSDGRVANIASVRVYVEADVPTLILDLRYADDAEGSPKSPSSGERRRAGDDSGAMRGEPTMVFGTEADAYPRIVSLPPSPIETVATVLRRGLGTLMRFGRFVRFLFSGDEKILRLG